MTQLVEQQPAMDAFTDRRSTENNATAGIERRQFAASYDDLSADARELAQAIDGYKLRHRRRFINFEEMLSVIHSLGYSR